MHVYVRARAETNIAIARGVLVLNRMRDVSSGATRARERSVERKKKTENRCDGRERERKRGEYTDWKRSRICERIVKRSELHKATKRSGRRRRRRERRRCEGEIIERRLGNDAEKERAREIERLDGNMAVAIDEPSAAWKHFSTPRQSLRLAIYHRHFCGRFKVRFPENNSNFSRRRNCHHSLEPRAGKRICYQCV